MNKKQTSSESSNQTRARRSRNPSRNSPNSKLLSAAWPKAPTVPTKKSHIKGNLPLNLYFYMVVF